ncbi:MAG: sulfatase-like hydrolase/transferase [Gemmatimonadota bacterium]|nr:sulfatase-like hydrolase/transferase [Gemmatimonadota bacterium]
MRGRSIQSTFGASILGTLLACSSPAADGPEAASMEPGDAAAPDTSAPPAALPAAGARPNVVVVVVDDLRYDELGVTGHPYVETPNIDRLAAEGALFERAFHAVPLCSPNRASLLTGQYPSRHGIIDNVARNLASHGLKTFPAALQRNGYATAFLGKWHMGNDPTPRPGFDEWVALPGQGRSENPVFFEDGELREVEGYTTDILTDRAVEFIRDREGPFAVYLAHKAVHPDIAQLDDGSVDPATSRGFVPAPRHLGRYDQAVFPRHPSTITSLDDLTGKPAIRHALESRRPGNPTELLGDAEGMGTNDLTIRRRAEMLLAVDDGVGRIVATLEELGILDETVIVFTSDNGYFYGEHGLTSERRMPYEESIRNPLIVRYPPRVAAGSRPDGLVSTVDLAPTILDLTGTPIGEHIQGRSVVPLFDGDDDGWRSSLLVEFYTYENPFPHLVDMDYRLVRTARMKYIHWMQHPGMDELYDLESDPYETRNRIDDPALADERQRLRTELGRLVLEAMGLGG